jgi:imidazolonepropionase-like amidohydrolase
LGRCASWPGAGIPTEPHTGASLLAINDVRIWDGVSDRCIPERQTLRIERGRIVAIGREPALLDGAEVLSFGSDCTALPGLIDAHIHLTLDPTIRDPEEQAQKSPEQVREESEVRALAMLRAGITTTRDLGGASWIELELRDRIARGELPGPRLLCAGQPVTRPEGHCFYWGGAASDLDGMRAVVQRQVERGVDWVKVMVTGGVITKGTTPKEAQYDAAELRVLREEAERHGRRVAAHCHGTEGIRVAVDAGLHTIEHCSWVGEKGFGSDFDPELAERIAELGICVSPTVNAGWKRFMERDGKPTRFYRNMREALTVLRERGARLIASTDAGIPGVEHHRLGAALAVFSRFAGLNPVEALRCATSESAEVLGLAEETGALLPGLAADILIVRGNPLEDLATLEEPLAVLARGRSVELNGGC